MRHKFTPEETRKGIQRSASSRKAEINLQKRSLKQQAEQFLGDALLKATEPGRIPYAAAFIYGSIAGGKIIDVLKSKKIEDMTPEEIFWLGLTDVEVGLMAVMAYGMATTPNQASVAGNASQILGAAFLGGIGLGALAVGPIATGQQAAGDLLPWSWSNFWKWFNGITGKGSG